MSVIDSQRRTCEENPGLNEALYSLFVWQTSSNFTSHH